MLQEHLSEPQWWIGAVLVLGFFLVMWRFARRPKHVPLTWDYCYDYVAEPAAAANPELAESFAGMLAELDPTARAEGTLIRFAVMNRGGLSIAADDHIRPLTVAFPPDARLVAARYVEHFGPAPAAPPEITEYERGIEIAPFDLPVGCALVLQIVVVGAEGPQLVDGGIDGQPAIEKLR